MSILVNPSVITDGLVGSFDILNSKRNTSSYWGDVTKKSTAQFVLDTGNYGDSIVKKDTIVDNVRCAAYYSNSTTPAYGKISNFTMSVRTYSFWIRKLPNYVGVLLPYFLDFTNSISDAFITSNGFGSYFTGSSCYYNGIYVGNNNYIISDILYGSLSEQWKNVVIVAPNTQLLDGEDLFLFGDSSQTNGNSTPYAVSQMQFYSRALTINEIASNFFAFNERYGL